ncbi:MAG: 4Fe-4S dicluster domain-containing protein [PVC group bacterium]|nr:4Fe-4S dicluster domain-containing protein [PVC group bacterium]
MGKRQIIKIDEEKCNGCGVCVPDCPEGALQVIDGKARLVGELLCDGLGACIGRCPEGAIEIEEREAEPYDEIKVMDNVVKAGDKVIAAHLKHLKDHNQDDYLEQAGAYLKEHNIPVPVLEEKETNLPCGCPGTMMKDFRADESAAPVQETSVSGLSQLRQWPIQLHLLNPQAPYFKDAELVIAADCVPFSYAGFHQRFLKGKTLMIFCPKLDTAKDVYVQKMADIFKNNNIKSITMVHMEVPCCFGLMALVEEALKLSGKNIILKEYNISLKGEIL